MKDKKKYTLKEKVNYKKIGKLKTDIFRSGSKLDRSIKAVQKGREPEKYMTSTYICEECHSDKIKQVKKNYTDYGYTHCLECEADTNLIERFECVCCGFSTTNSKIAYHRHVCHEDFPVVVRTQNKTTVLTKLFNEKTNAHWETDLKLYYEAYKARGLLTEIKSKGLLHGLYVEKDQLATERSSSFSEKTPNRIIK